jgi:hypothetical protein
MFSKFIRVTEDKLSLVISRSDWLYPLATEDDAGPVDEQRCAVLGGRDGDIVLHFVEGARRDAGEGRFCPVRRDAGAHLSGDGAGSAAAANGGSNDGKKVSEQRTRCT